MSPYALTPRNIQIRDNFDAIAPRYDLTNRVISLGIDLHWRRVAVRQLREAPAGGVALDLACGTCDMALEVLRQRRAARVVGADLSRVMLGLARKKLDQRLGRRGGDGAVDLVNAPAEALPFRDGSFDAVTIAFGLRNVPDYRAGLAEMLRVLRPGGRACILEFSTPPSKLWWKVYNYYFFNVLPRIGGLITGREAAYRYLTDSVSRFPDARALKAAMEESGFARVSFMAMNGGIVCVHTGIRL
ncbi:MAG: bifunctional demethylmenaquinone methyltransferase/2-methoxy-6-polyprenyl-1,4-benzoquinol methylase UbiE [Acidobacteria bacterium]|nr:MAG: bifunctional demethylmenaquinone methyltransferase/2-methoxy-6-polyprenyl-1,4-benzoquinol methylase UbiE [Acidobacteriota bacterium]